MKRGTLADIVGVKMMKCMVCNSPIRETCIDGVKYKALCRVCGMEYSIRKKEIYRVGDRVCNVPFKEGPIDPLDIGVVEEVMEPWRNPSNGIWIPFCYQVRFPPGAYGKTEGRVLDLFEDEIYKVTENACGEQK